MVTVFAGNAQLTYHKNGKNVKTRIKARPGWIYAPCSGEAAW
jgi:hypothetical protein